MWEDPSCIISSGKMRCVKRCFFYDGQLKPVLFRMLNRGRKITIEYKYVSRDSMQIWSVNTYETPLVAPVLGLKTSSVLDGVTMTYFLILHLSA